MSHVGRFALVERNMLSSGCAIQHIALQPARQAATFMTVDSVDFLCVCVLLLLGGFYCCSRSHLRLGLDCARRQTLDRQVERAIFVGTITRRRR